MQKKVVCLHTTVRAFDYHFFNQKTKCNERLRSHRNVNLKRIS